MEGDLINSDFFYVRPVRNTTAAFNSPIQAQELFGTYSTFKGFERPIDFYYIRFNNAATGAKFDTAGVAFAWQRRKLAVGHGRSNAMGLPRRDEPSSRIRDRRLGLQDGPTALDAEVWGYMDLGLPAARPSATAITTLFPLAHKYNGFMDLFGRRNLVDTNVLVTMDPHQRVNC